MFSQAFFGWERVSLIGIVSRVTDWSLRKLLSRQDVEKIDDHRERTLAAYLEGWLSIALNIVLFVVKLLLGLAIGSLAVVSDALHSLSDVLTSAVVVVGFRLAGSLPDAKHPFGHGRVETIASIAVSVLLVLTGLRLLYSSAASLIAPSGTHEVQVGIGAVMVMLASAAIKEWLALFSIDIGQRIRSEALMADGWHHRSDAISAVLAAAALVGSMHGVHWLDPVAGILVSVLIVRAGLQTLAGPLHDVMGRPPSAEEQGLLYETAYAVDGVEGVHDIVVHDYGRMKRVSLHIEVNPGHSVTDAHGIAETVESELEKLGGLSAVVHVDPLAADFASVDPVPADSVPVDPRPVNPVSADSVPADSPSGRSRSRGSNHPLKR
jgi:cation diffusion facilitator family transporter